MQISLASIQKKPSEKGSSKQARLLPCSLHMRDDQTIIEAACKKLNAMPGSALKDLTEIEIQVHLPEHTQEQTFTVFFERSGTDQEDQWSARNIVRPDQLQSPQGKDPEKLE